MGEIFFFFGKKKFFGSKKNFGRKSVFCFEKKLEKTF